MSISSMWAYGISFAGYRLVAGEYGRWLWIMEREPPFPLEGVFTEIKAALDGGFYYLAATTALSLPDVCSSLEWDPDPGKIDENRRGQSRRYIEWFRVYLGEKFEHLTGDDCFRLRCGLLHNGKLGRPRDNYEKVAFMLERRPAPKEVLYDGNIINGVYTGKLLVLNLAMFCDLMIDAARRWYADAKNDKFVRANLLTLIRVRPEGMPPFLSETPVLAGETKWAGPSMFGFKKK